MYEVDYEIFKNKKSNETFKRVELNCKGDGWNKEYPIPIESGECEVPEGVTSIGKCCFEYCKLLTSIPLPTSLRSICDRAFSNTNILTIRIPEGMTSIGEYCFYYYSSLTSIQLPSTLLKIGDCAFNSGTEITDIFGNDDVSTVDEIPLKQVEVPKNCKIGGEAFDYGCKVILK